MIPRELVPFCTTVCGSVALATPASSAALVAATAGIDRWVFGFTVGNQSALNGQQVQLETLGGVPVYRVMPGGSIFLANSFYGPVLLPVADNGLRISTILPAGGAQTYGFTIHFANDGLRTIAAKLRGEAFYVGL